MGTPLYKLEEVKGLEDTEEVFGPFPFQQEGEEFIPSPFGSVNMSRFGPTLVSCDS